MHTSMGADGSSAAPEAARAGAAPRTVTATGAASDPYPTADPPPNVTEFTGPNDGIRGGGGPGTARVPKYYRLKRQLLEMTETLPTGAPVPPERTLAGNFGVSRTTVRQALHELVVEGRLERIQGKGTFVARPKVPQVLRLTSYAEDLRAQEPEPASRLLDIGYIPADERLAELLHLPANARVLRIERLRLAGGDPMAIEAAHLPPKRFPALHRHLTKYGSLHATLAEAYDVRLAEAEETIETSLATPREAGLLGTDVGLPMLMLSRHSLDTEGRPVEWVRSVYRGDRYKFVARLQQPGG